MIEPSQNSGSNPRSVKGKKPSVHSGLGVRRGNSPRVEGPVICGRYLSKS